MFFGAKTIGKTLFSEHNFCPENCCKNWWRPYFYRDALFFSYIGQNYRFLGENWHL